MVIIAMLFYALLTILSFIILWIYPFQIWARYHLWRQNVKGPFFVPFSFGEILATLNWLFSASNFKFFFCSQCLEFFQSRIAKFGDIYCHQLGHRTIIHLADPDYLGNVLKTKENSFGKTLYLQRLLAPLLGDSSVILANGLTHKSLKKELTPSFHFRNLESYLPLFISNTILR